VTGGDELGGRPTYTNAFRFSLVWRKPQAFSIVLPQ